MVGNVRTSWRPWVGVALVLGELLLVGCTNTGVVTSAQPYATPGNTNVASTSTGLVPASSLPLGQGSPGAGTGNAAPTTSGTATGPSAAAGQQQGAAPFTTAPSVGQNANLVQSSNTTGTPPPAANANGVTVATPTQDVVLLEGDVSRFKYAFFTKTTFEYGDSHVFPFFGVIFTADPNLCERAVAPLHISEFTAYQLWPDATALEAGSNVTLNFNALFNAATYYGFNNMRGYYTEDLPPPGSNEVGYQGQCGVYSNPPGGRSFAQASWQLTPPADKTLDDAETVIVALHARNSVQEIAWTLQAKRCAGIRAYFQDLGGHHFFPQEMACANVAGVTPSATLNPNVAASPNDAKL